MRTPSSHWIIRGLITLALMVAFFYVVLDLAQPGQPSTPAPRPTATRPTSARPTTAAGRATPAPGAATPGGAVGSGAPGDLPVLDQKPKPVEITFQGCPPEGDGGDKILNQLKNRVDATTFSPVQFDSVLGLRWPQATERKSRSGWSSADAAEISRYEGIPIAVEGYLANAKQEGPESPNCHGADAPLRDFHIWLTATAGEDRTRSIVVEMTPRVRDKHPGWTISALQNVAQSKQKVRVSGWLMFDQEHPDQIGKTRGTIWEIHPIIALEVEQGGRWVPLDSLR